MKRTLLITITLFILLVTPSIAFAQGMMGNWGSSPSSAISDDHTAREEAEGKEIREKLQAKQTECKNLTNDDYQSLGEYFMGQSIGNTQRHAFMNQMMTNMMGEDGEKQMHIVMGKRLSSCDTKVSYPQNSWGIMPMMWMMAPLRQGFVGQEGGGNPMMGYGGWEKMQRG